MRKKLKNNLNSEDKAILIAAREILEEKIEKERLKLPFALTANHLSKLLGMSKRKVYDALATGDIPGAKKINQSWRVPRDTFLSWWYGIEMRKDKNENY